VFGWLSRKRRGATSGDPIAAFDEVIQSLERQGVEVRKSAATLIALRSDLRRDRQKYAVRMTEIGARLATAARDGDEVAERALERDRDQTTRLLAQTEQALADADRNSRELLEAADGLGRQAADLKAERQSARARLSSSVEVSEALKARSMEFERLMRLDEARDEIERAQALADLYREDASAKG
jgi:phage shock protein A